MCGKMSYKEIPMIRKKFLKGKKKKKRERKRMWEKRDGSVFSSLE